MRIFIKSVAFWLVSFLLFSILSLNVGAEGENIGSISARSACLIEAESGRVLYSKNADKRLPMASTTKIMTAIVAIESGIALNSVVKIPKSAVGIEGSSMYLYEGEELTFEALIYGLLLSSANDASVAIAITVAGSVERFVEMMNKKAQELSLTNTFFTNPHGLYHKEHYTTANELAILMAYCIKNPIFLTISGCREKTVAMNEDSARVLVNHNRLLRTYSGVIAGKTGFTKMSGRCLVTSAERDGLRLIAVTLNAPNDWQDHTNLYDFGFSNYQRIFFDEFSITIPVVSGTTDQLVLKAKGTSLFLPRDYQEVTTEIQAPSFVFGGVKMGEQIGKIVYKSGNKVVAVVPLIASENVNVKKYKFNLFEWLIDLIKGFLK